MGLGRALKSEFSFIEGNYLILVVSWIVMDIGMEMPVPYYQQYVDALGGNIFPMALGIIGFANFFAMAFVAVPGGFLADKFGRRWLITTMTFGIGLSYLFFALAPFWTITASWHLILVGTIIQSLCLIYQPALFAMVQDSVPQERRGVGSSIIQMIHGTMNTPGTVIGGLLVVALGLILGMQVVYVAVMVLFIAAAIWRLKLKETIANAQKIRFRYFISHYPQAIKESLRVWRVVPRTVFYLFIVQVMVMFALALINVINAIYARDVLGISQNDWFLTYIPMLLTMVIAAYPIGKIIDRVGMKLPLAIAPCVLAASLLLFINGNIFTVTIAMALFGLVHMLMMSAGMALSACLVEPQNRGKINGGLNFVGYILTGIGMLFGNLFYNITPQLPFFIAVALSIPMMLIVLFRISEPKKEERKF
ncbi:TPA: MFS transporter [Candidatus Bathyarchaeota archaeon]|nr:MFS transporter [Candidatus Bathyarchaeota archaeon]